MRELKIENPMRAPRLHKIVINMSLSEARDNARFSTPRSRSSRW